MPHTSLSKEEKQAIWIRVQHAMGPVYTPSRRPDWRLTKDNRTSVFVTFSQFYERPKQYWYDVGRDDLNNWRKYERAFVIFVAGSHRDTFIIPVVELREHIYQSNIIVAQDGTFKLHIKRDRFHQIVECPKLDIMAFYQNYSLLKGESSASPTYRQIKETKVRYEAEEPEDIVAGEMYYEGATTKISVNVYERNAEARRVCLHRHGFNCSICEFNFEAVYGEVGEGFIHVHHLKPLSEITGTYQLDPVKDLRPVCPNCHAMLHRRKPAYSIDEIKEMLQKRKIPV
jgi:hypothetical protein